MLGLGETRDELLDTLADLLDAGVQMLTLGQYLQPTPEHLPVVRYVPPAGVRRAGPAGPAAGLPPRRQRALRALQLPRPRNGGGRIRGQGSGGQGIEDEQCRVEGRNQDIRAASSFFPTSDLAGP